MVLVLFLKHCFHPALSHLLLLGSSTLAEWQMTLAPNMPAVDSQHCENEVHPCNTVCL